MNGQAVLRGNFAMSTPYGITYDTDTINQINQTHCYHSTIVILIVLNMTGAGHADIQRVIGRCKDNGCLLLILICGKVFCH